MRKSQEPRLTAHYSQDENMLKAYEEDKDLYAVIAQSMYNNNYEDNLEFFSEFSEIKQDNKLVIAGTGKSHEIETDDNTFIAPACYIVTTLKGEKSLSNIVVGDVITSSDKNIYVTEVKTASNTIIENKTVKNIYVKFSC